MKKILLIATGGTIASKYTSEGLCPQISSEELLSYVPTARKFCEIDTVQPFNLDSTNINASQWLALAALIERKYEYYDGFVICHGTDTMAYTAAALPITDARANLRDSLRFASHDRAHGVNIVFGGEVIAGTRAKKERSKSFNAFSSINFPQIAIIQDSRIIFYIDDKDQSTTPLKFCHTLNDRVFLLKLIPGISGRILEALYDSYDAVIIESFGVGGLPNYGDDSFHEMIQKFISSGKIVIMATQVTHEGSDMEIYQVGKVMKDQFNLIESYDMTLEATVAKTMWALGQAGDVAAFQELFYKTINHDLLFWDGEENRN